MRVPACERLKRLGVLARTFAGRGKLSVGALLIASAIGLATAVGLVPTSDGARSQPAQTVKLVVPFPPGGINDLIARLLAQQVGLLHGTAVVVENRPGAASVIGTEVVSRAAADGTTLLVPANSFVIQGILRKLAYDPLTSFEPVCYLAHTPHVWVVNSASPYRSLPDLLAAARAKPGELTVGSVGPATAQHIAFEMFRRAAGINMTFVPFAGNAPVVNAILGGHLDSAWVNYPDVGEHLRSGKLRALATTLPKRFKELPEVPTIAESGYPNFESETWVGIVAPAKTPAQTVGQLAKLFADAMQAPEVKAKFLSVGLRPVVMCGDEFGNFLRRQHDDYSRVIHDANIKVE